MKQPLWIKMKVLWHCLRKRHKKLHGIQVGIPLIFCECGYYKPRINSRDGENPWKKPHRTLTDPEAKKLLDGLYNRY